MDSAQRGAAGAAVAGGLDCCAAAEDGFPRRLLGKKAELDAARAKLDTDPKQILEAEPGIRLTVEA